MIVKLSDIDAYLLSEESPLVKSGCEVYPTIADQQPISSNDYIVYKYVDNNIYYNSKDMSVHQSVTVQISILSQSYDEAIRITDEITNNWNLLNTVGFEGEISGTNVVFEDNYFIASITVHLKN